MKPMMTMALVMLLSSTLILTANAGTITTTKTTTTVTTTHYSCKNRYHKHYKKYRYYRGCPSYRYSYYDNSDDWNQCPGGAYDCYWDLQNNYYRQNFYPISYDHNIKYSCLQSDDPASCS